MKYTAKKVFAAGLVSTLVFSSGVAVIPASANALDDLLNGSGSPAASEATLSTEMKVTGVTALPKNGKISLVWNPVKSGDTLITKYEISRGTKSVEEGIADTYDSVIKVNLDADTIETSGLAKTDVPALTNGQKYFFSIRAIAADGTKGSKSDEIFATPTSDSASSTTTSDSASVNLELEEGIALTQKIVKVTLSKDVVLPEDKDVLASSFVVNIKNDPDTILEVESAILRDNYYIDPSDLMAQKELKDNEVYIILTDAMTLEKEYQVTVSARIKDEAGESIENGVVDNFVFAGTDATEIPEDEVPEAFRKNKNQEQTIASNSNQVIPVSAQTNMQQEQNITQGSTIQDTEDQGLKSAPIDKQAPEEITNLTYLLKERVKDFVVTMAWDSSKNTAGDAIKQLLYISLDNGKTWGNPQSLDMDKEEFPFTALENKNYMVKISTQDRSGNESMGVIKNIKIPELVSSGAPAFLAFGLALMGGGFLSLRKREELS